MMMNKRNVGKSSFQISRQNLHTQAENCTHPLCLIGRETVRLGEARKNIKNTWDSAQLSTFLIDIVFSDFDMQAHIIVGIYSS